MPVDQAGGESENQQPREDGAVDVEHATSTSDRIEWEKSFQRVPSLGSGRRWCDKVFWFMGWLQKSWRGRLLPRSARRWLHYGLLYLNAINSRDRYKIKEYPGSYPEIPESQRATVPAIWVVELFPPSKVNGLNRAIRANGWDSSNKWHSLLETNEEFLGLSRTGQNVHWWRIAELISHSSQGYVPDAIRAKLPSCFDSISLMGAEIGPGLTAVIARFELTESASLSANSMLHDSFEPEIVINNKMAMAEGREWVRYRKTQLVKKQVHQAARTWMKRRCRGFFASQREPQPVIDLTILDQINPFEVNEESETVRSTLRALGITDTSLLSASNQLPGFVLESVGKHVCPTLYTPTTWILWGYRRTIEAEFVPGKGADGSGDHGVVFLVHEHAYEFFAVLACRHLVAILESNYAHSRDQAATKQAVFKNGPLKRIRRGMLSTSLDIGSLRRDIESFYDRKSHYAFPQFIYSESPFLKARNRELGYEDLEEVDFNQRLRDAMTKQLDVVAALDKEYRDVISTASALGSAVDNRRTARIAMFIAVMSLFVAIFSLLGTEVKSDTALKDLLEWLGSLF